MNQLRFLTLVDRVISAELDIRIFAPGSLEPLTASILEELQGGEPIRFDQLATKLGLADGPRRRILAEIIAALERSQDITVTRAADACIVVRGLALRKSLAVRTFFQLQTVQFLPPARYMAQKIWAQNLHQLADFERENAATISVWQRRWPDLYEDDALKLAIEHTYESVYRSRFGRVDGANEYRDEILQRSQLLPTEGRVAKANVLKTSTLDLVMYHRCYLYPTRSADRTEWKVVIRRYPSGGEQTSYTQYLTDRCHDPRFLNELIECARPISSLNR
ncbi:MULTISPECIES: hypothetical protein [unclassified Bradyrhizobium]|uniref:hypothetical protein n=1 Tax=unclassified Bradyrhizobium TaxID=2631580 RepID=UPI00291655BF|nr:MULTISPECIES: hypothetical protein [unclassified Bradyrhizobium]